MTNQVYAITGNKISSIVIDNNSIKFSSKTFATYEEFIADWSKKISLANKLEIKLNQIESIYKEENDAEIAIKYKSWRGIFTLSKYTEAAFSFQKSENTEPFFDYFVQQHYYQKSNEHLTPFQAIRVYIFGLLFVLGFTYLGYTESIAPTEGGGVKGRMFRTIVEVLGTNGVLIAGALATCYFLFTIWKRYNNPPQETKITPPNSL